MRFHNHPFFFNARAKENIEATSFQVQRPSNPLTIYHTETNLPSKARGNCPTDSNYKPFLEIH